MQTRAIQVGEASIAVEVADTELARSRGLSGRAGLAEGTGLLFVFEQDDYWGIWMKDMRFSIDIVWLDAQGLVLTVAREVAPETYPHTFIPQAPARYVLELPAGSAQRHGIAEGVQVVVQ